ncbi:hypothetical protein CPB86DRAFT_551939 [Serendipita vermifera]|nr:hypothetical protein CPB86DRAFT_551939 [Serendipita vermifera]
MQQHKPLKALYLDYGSPSGALSQLYILKRIISDSLVRKHFDLIAGSGLGGLVAIMLGPLGMTIEDAIDDIQMLGMTVFESVDVDAKTPVVDGQTLKTALETILESKGVLPDATLGDIPCCSSCKSVIFLADSGDKPMMRSYIVNKPSARYNIVDGVVASISPSLLTSPTMECTLQTLIDNRTTFTSPIVELVKEVELAFKAESQAVYLLHVGSGGPGPDIPEHESGLEYHYISVEPGIEKDTIMAWTTWDLGAVKDCTDSYLDQPQVSRAVGEVATSIGESVTENGALGFLDGDYMDEEEFTNLLLDAHRETVEPSADFAQLMAKTAVLLNQFQFVNDEVALEEQRCRLGPRHSTTIETLSRVAGTRLMAARSAEPQERERQLDQVVSLYRELISLRQDVNGIQDEKLFNEMGLLASIYRNRKQWHEAIDVYKKLALLQKKVYGEQCKQVVGTLHFLGMCLGIVGDVEQATEIVDEGIQITKTINDDQDPIYLTSLQGIKVLYNTVHGEHSEETFALFANMNIW